MGSEAQTLDTPKRSPRLEGEEPAGAGSVAARDGETPRRDATDGDSNPSAHDRAGTYLENGEVKQLSVSSIAKYDSEQPGGCPRRWWYRYVARKPEPQTKAAQAGEEMHKRIERHLLYGEKLVGRTRCLEQLCKELRNERVAVEQPVAGGLYAAGIPLVGRIDVVRWEIPCVLDWKSTSKEPDELPHDRDLIRTVQMPGYGQWLFNALPEAKLVHLEHVYVKSGWREPECRWMPHYRQEIRDRWGEVEDVVRKLVNDARAESAEDVPPNTDACDAFGGCPHRRYCSAGGTTVLSLYDELKKAKQQQSVLPPDAPKSGEAAPAAEPFTPEELKERPELAEFDNSDVHPQIAKCEVAFSGAFTKAIVERVINLGNYESVRVGLEMTLQGARDPKEPLHTLVTELDAFGEEYRTRRKK